jgi:iron-sulfur cluster assembly accessory protein
MESVTQVETQSAGVPAGAVDVPMEIPTPPSPVTLTAKAVEMIKTTMERENLLDSALRVGVQGGGCSGFQYSLDLEKETRAGDLEFSFEGIKIYIDPMSAQYLKGTQIDYVETAYASGFSFSNPQAKSTCGCGSSFSV